MSKTVTGTKIIESWPEREGELRVLNHIISEDYEVVAPERASVDFIAGIKAGIDAVKHFARQRRDLMEGKKEETK